MKILVLGLGNPILSDDSVGFSVLERLKPRFDRPDLIFRESSASGLDLLELIIGYEKLIIIDAIQTRGGEVGKIYRFTQDDLVDTRRTASPHSTNLFTAIKLGKKLGEPLPERILIFAIEVADVTTFSEKCTSEVEKAIPLATAMVTEEIEEELNRGQ